MGRKTLPSEDSFTCTDLEVGSDTGTFDVKFKIAELYMTAAIELEESDEFEWDGDVAAGDWNNLYTPTVGSSETGYIMVIDEKDDGSYDMAYVKYTEAGGGSVTLVVEEASTRVQFQDNSGTIQIANNVNPGAGHWLKAYTRISVGTD